MGIAICILGLLLAIAAGVMLPRGMGPLRGAAVLAAMVVAAAGFALGSVKYVGAGEVGIVTKNALDPSLQDGRIIATKGEMGVQADVLAPGWHWWYWPVLYTVKTVPLIEVKGDEVGIIETRDGAPLPPGQLFAADWKSSDLQKMLDAKHFLTAGGGFKGRQATVLTPGQYRVNTELYAVRMLKQTEVKAGEVAVLTANYGAPPTIKKATQTQIGNLDETWLADDAEMGVRQRVLPPGKYALNTEAFTVTEIWTTEMVAHYTASAAANPVSRKSDGVGHAVQDEREIIVRTADGFTFPVDVRVSYKIDAASAPLVVARLGDDEGERFRGLLNTVVRAAFRNSAEGVRALDYVQQRSQQEDQAREAIARHMKELGVTVTGVNIGSIGDEKSLGALLLTQTQREIAKQEQVTFAEQQRAAEKKKELSRTTQEAEEEKRLATAAYAVRIAEEEKKQRVIAAGAEAESIRIKAEAQAKAYELVSRQVGSRNAAMLEMLKIVGETGVQITPRVMVAPGYSGAPGGQSPETAALVGTMLEWMASRQDETPPPVRAQSEQAKPASAPGR